MEAVDMDISDSSDEETSYIFSVPYYKEKNDHSILLSHSFKNNDENQDSNESSSSVKFIKKQPKYSCHKSGSNGLRTPEKRSCNEITIPKSLLSCSRFSEIEIDSKLFKYTKGSGFGKFWPCDVHKINKYWREKNTVAASEKVKNKWLWWNFCNKEESSNTFDMHSIENSSFSSEYSEHYCHSNSPDCSQSQHNKQSSVDLHGQLLSESCDKTETGSVSSCNSEPLSNLSCSAKWYDPHRYERCRALLKSKPCKNKSCEKLHRLPKEDGVFCRSFILKSFCSLGKNCFYLHREKSTYTNCNDKANCLSINKSLEDHNDGLDEVLSLCMDPYKSERCKNYLNSASCSLKSCSKLHRLPKEDGIYCRNFVKSSCKLGNTCFFLHNDITLNKKEVEKYKSESRVEIRQNCEVPLTHKKNIDKYSLKQSAHLNQDISKSLCVSDVGKVPAGVIIDNPSLSSVLLTTSNGSKDKYKCTQVGSVDGEASNFDKSFDKIFNRTDDGKSTPQKVTLRSLSAKGNDDYAKVREKIVSDYFEEESHKFNRYNFESAISTNVDFDDLPQFSKNSDCSNKMSTGNILHGCSVSSQNSNKDRNSSDNSSDEKQGNSCDGKSCSDESSDDEYGSTRPLHGVGELLRSLFPSSESIRLESIPKPHKIGNLFRHPGISESNKNCSSVEESHEKLDLDHEKVVSIVGPILKPIDNDVHLANPSFENNVQSRLIIENVTIPVNSSKRTANKNGNSSDESRNFENNSEPPILPIGNYCSILPNPKAAENKSQNSITSSASSNETIPMNQLNDAQKQVFDTSKMSDSGITKNSQNVFLDVVPQESVPERFLTATSFIGDTVRNSKFMKILETPVHDVILKNSKKLTDSGFENISCLPSSTNFLNTDIDLSLQNSSDSRESSSDSSDEDDHRPPILGVGNLISVLRARSTDSKISELQGIGANCSVKLKNPLHTAQNIVHNSSEKILAAVNLDQNCLLEPVPDAGTAVPLLMGGKSGEMFEYAESSLKHIDTHLDKKTIKHSGNSIILSPENSPYISLNSDQKDHAGIGVSLQNLGERSKSFSEESERENNLRQPSHDIRDLDNILLNAELLEKSMPKNQLHTVQEGDHDICKNNAFIESLPDHNTSVSFELGNRSNNSKSASKKIDCATTIHAKDKSTNYAEVKLHESLSFAENGMVESDLSTPKSDESSESHTDESSSEENPRRPPIFGVGKLVTSLQTNEICAAFSVPKLQNETLKILKSVSKNPLHEDYKNKTVHSNKEIFPQKIVDSPNCPKNGSQISVLIHNDLHESKGTTGIDGNKNSIFESVPLHRINTIPLLASRSIKNFKIPKLSGWKNERLNDVNSKSKDILMHACNQKSNSHASQGSETLTDTLHKPKINDKSFSISDSICTEKVNGKIVSLKFQEFISSRKHKKLRSKSELLNKKRRIIVSDSSDESDTASDRSTTNVSLSEPKKAIASDYSKMDVPFKDQQSKFVSPKSSSVNISKGSTVIAKELMTPKKRKPNKCNHYSRSSFNTKKSSKIENQFASAAIEESDGSSVGSKIEKDKRGTKQSNTVTASKKFNQKMKEKKNHCVNSSSNAEKKLKSASTSINKRKETVSKANLTKNEKPVAKQPTTGEEENSRKRKISNNVDSKTNLVKNNLVHKKKLKTNSDSSKIYLTVNRKFEKGLKNTELNVYKKYLDTNSINNTNNKSSQDNLEGISLENVSQSGEVTKEKAVGFPINVPKYESDDSGMSETTSDFSVNFNIADPLQDLEVTGVKKELLEEPNLNTSFKESGNSDVANINESALQEYPTIAKEELAPCYAGERKLDIDDNDSDVKVELVIPPEAKSCLTDQNFAEQKNIFIKDKCADLLQTFASNFDNSRRNDKFYLLEKFTLMCETYAINDIESSHEPSYEALDRNIRRFMTAMVERKHGVAFNTCNIYIDYSLSYFINVLNKVDEDLENLNNR